MYTVACIYASYSVHVESSKAISYCQVTTCTCMHDVQSFDHCICMALMWYMKCCDLTRGQDILHRYTAACLHVMGQLTRHVGVDKWT